MPNMIRVTTITAIISTFLLSALGMQYFVPADSVDSVKSVKEEREYLPAEEAGNLLISVQDSDCITMYGDPKDWDDEKNMCFDTNGDGQNDITFAISSSRSEGIGMEGAVKQKDGSWKSMNFWSSDLYRLLRYSLDEKAQARRCITGDDFVQITFCDVDRDGSNEILASAGNRLYEYVTAVYKVSGTGNVPFIYRGSIISNQ